MPKSNIPYDPQPERQDALEELAREGYQAVPGDHAAKLKSLQDRLGLPGETAVPTDAVIRAMRSRRWLAIAAGVAALVVAGIVLMIYDTPQQQLAKVAEPLQQAEVQAVPEATTASARVVVTQKDEEEASLEATASEFQQPDATRESPVVDAANTEELVETTSTTSSSALLDSPVAAASPAAKRKSSAPVSSEPEPRSKAVVEKIDRSKESATDMLTDEIAEQEPSRFRMERAPTVQTREITGEVLEPSGAPIIGATLTIEETGQQVITDQQGEFSIVLTDKAVVGNLTAPGHNTLMFDLTAGEEYQLFMPRVSSSLPSAQLKGKSIGLRLIAPKAIPYPAFDTHVAGQYSSFSGQTVIIQFEVNRFGRPRQIVPGPGTQDRDAIKVVKDWLKNGPDWPEVYQRKSWRYAVIMP